MNAERLEMVAYILENLPQERHVMTGGPKGIPDKFDMATWYSCGTTACAIGFASLHPWFRRRGLKLITEGDETPAYKGETHYRAVMAFFGLMLLSASENS